MLINRFGVGARKMRTHSISSDTVYEISPSERFEIKARITHRNAEGDNCCLKFLVINIKYRVGFKLYN